MEKGKTMAEAIYKIRRKNKLSQKEMAEQLKVSQAAISQFESGKTVPGHEIMAAILTEYGVNLLQYQQRPAKPRPKLRIIK